MISTPTEWEDYLFDLQGFLVLKNVVSPELIAEINETVDHWVRLHEAGHKWIGHVRCSDPEPVKGPDIKFANIIEGGPAFEALIDNPNWLEYVKRYVDNDGLYIWANHLSVSRKGSYVPVHSGGHNRGYRTSFRYHNDNFYCGNFNVLLALNDIGPGDGGTMIVPGSHKCNVVNPLVFEAENGRHKTAVEETKLRPYLKEMHLNAGDAVIFTDACTHGASVRTNDGERRILIYRYTAFWMKNATGFEPSEELLARLTPERRKIIRPIVPIRPPAQSVTA